MNSLDPSGLSLFRLRLKVRYPVILLRNITPKDGLRNGTRLMVVRSSLRLIESNILTGCKAGNLVFIPRISLTLTSDAMTINKSQDQSVKFVGIDLTTSIFSHGQLYVALSRYTSPK
ncbi:hypothetical protein GIB67_021341 [Kingdonia uniflora]|uniref:DNA helicase Pif1-like 2B domain-containing protein n=1 Tax=Kingdonia uniflora TaxID=39325 RepID=A0A7J7MCS4_9MAGN|nr:hypothetical protein GIB67_021341 [Kingdonia uniflora]